MNAHVVRISIAPVKALALIHPEEVSLTGMGIVGDRRFWLRDENGGLYNAKRDGSLLRVRSEWDEATRYLALTFPDGERVEGTVRLGPWLDEVQLYDIPRPDMREVIGPWQDALREYTGKKLSFLWAEWLAIDRAFASGSVSAISVASVERVGDEAGASAPLDGRRFRMTFEIDGVDAHAEDDWIGKLVQIGGARVSFSGEIGRCNVTSLDPDTGIADVPTLATLAAYRRHGYKEDLPCGLRGRVNTPGRVRIGDEVHVLSEAPELELRRTPAA
jgi:uncharacterized protein